MSIVVLLHVNKKINTGTLLPYVENLVCGIRKFRIPYIKNEIEQVRETPFGSTCSVLK